MNPQQALSQSVTAWQGLAFPLKGRRKEGPSDPGQRLLLPAHHGRPCPSGKAAPQLGSHPQFLHPRTWLAPQFWKQLTMNERSSLMFPAHLLVKQPPGQPHAPYPTRLLFQLPLPCPSLCWISLPPPYPLPTVGPPAPSAWLGRRQACHIAAARKAPPRPSLPTSHQQGKPPGDAWGWVFIVQRCEPPGHPLSFTCSGLEGHLLPVTPGESASFWLSAPPAPLKHKKVGNLDEAHCGLDFQTTKGKNETESLLLRH